MSTWAVINYHELLDESWAKYHDLSMASRQVICRCRRQMQILVAWHWQIMIFAIVKFNSWSIIQKIIKVIKCFFLIYLDVIININIINFYKQIASVYAYKASSIDSFKNCDFSYLFPWSICSLSDFTICNNA